MAGVRKGAGVAAARSDAKLALRRLENARLNRSGFEMVRDSLRKQGSE